MKMLFDSMKGKRKEKQYGPIEVILGVKADGTRCIEGIEHLVFLI